jgi:hypothetical protein
MAATPTFELCIGEQYRKELPFDAIFALAAIAQRGGLSLSVAMDQALANQNKIEAALEDPGTRLILRHPQRKTVQEVHWVPRER